MYNIISVMMMTYKDKVRNFGFLAVIFATVIGTYLCIPEKSPLIVMTIEPGVITQGGNPSWMPMVSAMGICLFLPVLGFFYFRTDLITDHKKGMAGLITTTQTTNLQYTIGRYLAHIIILTQIIGVSIISTFRNWCDVKKYFVKHL